MERISLQARRRDGLGKGQARKLRRTGQVPGVVYGRRREPLPVVVEAKSLRNVLHTQAGMNVLIDLSIANGDRAAETVMVKDVQRDIFLRDIIHVDFHTISLTETLEAHVRLSFVGQAPGVAEGGVFEVHLREVVIECLPTQIPEHVEVDINGLAVGDSIHVRDLKVPPEVTIVTPVEEVVATVVMPKAVEEVAPAAAPAEVPVAEAAEPEAKAEAKPAEKAKVEAAKPAEKAKPAEGGAKAQ